MGWRRRKNNEEKERMRNLGNRLGGEIKTLGCYFMGKGEGKKLKGRKRVGRKKEEMRERERGLEKIE